MREARGKIRGEFMKALEKYPTDHKDFFNLQEYERFKKYQDAGSNEFWKEIETFCSYD